MILRSVFRRGKEGGMDEVFFGEGWLDDLLKEPAVPEAFRARVRVCLQEAEKEGKASWEDDWKEVSGLVSSGEAGTALGKGVESLRKAVEILEEVLRGEEKVLERPFSPFLIRKREIRRVLHPREDVVRLAASRDDLDMVISLELINDARRLLASWGVSAWGEEPLRLIPRLENDLEELRRIQASLQMSEESELEDLDEQVELADRFASAATRFALDLLDLHLLNAHNPEVPLRFRILWDTVRQLEEEDEVSAAFEALQVFQELLQLAGLGGGEALEMVDLLYDRLSDPEGLRRAVDRLTLARREGEGYLAADEAGGYIRPIFRALRDLGIEMEDTG